jgi:hypothetical protein
MIPRERKLNNLYKTKTTDNSRWNDSGLSNRKHNYYYNELNWAKINMNNA